MKYKIRANEPASTLPTFVRPCMSDPNLISFRSTKPFNNQANTRTTLSLVMYISIYLIPALCNLYVERKLQHTGKNLANR